MITSLSAGMQRLGKYELRERLGHSGMTELWKAFDAELHRYVAIKLFHANLQTDPEFSNRFSREAREVATLHHPNIVQVQDFELTHFSDADAPVAYMVMDYVEGETLADYIRSTSRADKFPDPSDIVYLFASISKALDYAHREGIVHGNIKPANILLDKRHLATDALDEPMLTDFGTARIVGADAETINGTWLGTPLYVSPEQAQGHAGTERSDIYSLGVILYEICTGVCPFHGDSIPTVLMQHVSWVPRRPELIRPAIPPALSEVIMCAMAKNPEERFSSASALTAALAEAFHLPRPAGLFLSALLSSTVKGSRQFRPDQFGSSPGIAQERESQAQPVVSTITAALNPITPPLSGVGFSVEAPLRDTNTPPPKNLPLKASPPNAQSRRVWKLMTVLVIVFILANSTIVFLSAFHTGQASPTQGTLTFTDSEQYDPNTTVGYNDIVSLSAHSLTPPEAGKTYFAWLMPDQTDDETIPLLLGRLTVNAGNATLRYASPTHTNLLAHYSGVRVTEQPDKPDPSTPSQDPKTWCWEGWLPNTPIPGDPHQYSFLSHLRHLLAEDPILQENNIPGGLVTWTTRNVAKVQEWSSAAQGSWGAQMSDGDADLIHKNLIRMLDYLDGESYAWQDVPAGSPWLVDPVAGKIGLLSYTQDQQMPGYLQHVSTHLQGITDAPNHTDEQKNTAIEVSGVITRMIDDLTQVRKDAVQLVQRSNMQLRQADTLTLLNEMATLTKEANSGWFDEGTRENVGGAIWLNVRIQELATISLRASA